MMGGLESRDPRDPLKMAIFGIYVTMLDFWGVYSVYPPRKNSRNVP